MQKKLYLVDEKEILAERQTSSGSLNPKEATSLEEIKGSLTEIRPGIWKASQSFIELYHQQFPGSGTLEAHARSFEEEWKEDGASVRPALAAVLETVGAATSLVRHVMVGIRYWIQVFEFITRMNVAVVFVGGDFIISRMLRRPSLHDKVYLICFEWYLFHGKCLLWGLGH